jgi:hypothetical protein
VPNTPPELAAWLNARRVPLEGDAFDGLVPVQHASRRAPRGAPHERHAANPGSSGRRPKTRRAFAGVPRRSRQRRGVCAVTKAAEIDRLLQRCPKCHGTWLGRFLIGIAAAPARRPRAIARTLIDEKLEPRRAASTTRKGSTMNRTVILACSARKRRDVGELSALARYDGPAWRTLRTNLTCMIEPPFALSAEYGLISVYQEIPDYDRQARHRTRLRARA